MKRLVVLPAVLIIVAGCTVDTIKYSGLSEDMLQAKKDSLVSDTIVYHQVRVDHNGNILPWYSSDLGQSYDYVLGRVWDFWKNMEVDSNGMKYYMNHQVWDPRHDKRGLGGDQLMMALSSWDLYFNYTGDQSLIDNMKYMADYYLTHSLTPGNSKWPNLPYPYNMDVEKGIYDGDMILGKDFLQPDKAGSFGFELVKLYKKTGDEKYLDAAVKIANTLAEKVQPGDSIHSPWPFKVNAITGDTGLIVLDQAVWYEGMDKDLKNTKSKTMKSGYTTFWPSSLELFANLMQLKKGNTEAYKKAFGITNNWLRTFPAKTNKWGPFFEDVPRWSDTQINAMTYAMYLIEHPELDPNWETTVKNIIQWVHKELDNKKFSNYGVIPTDEQTAYRQPGNSHSSRQASVELMYWEKTGDTSFIQNAIRQLSWATYMVDNDGKNFYPTNAIWMTDGYGDYVRHYLRAMAAAPQLAPANADHLLRTTSIVKNISYAPQQITYSIFDNTSKETFRLTTKPKKLKVNGNNLNEVTGINSEGWTWQSLDEGGVLKINHQKGNKIEIIK